jgi:FkbM family methyltransferase
MWQTPMLPTKTKMHLASGLSSAVLAVRSVFAREPTVVARRRGVNWRLDLNEGIDFAIYVGLYQKIPQRVIGTLVRPSSLVLDIGANIGSHALTFAAIVGEQGRVVAIEPTNYGFSKLTANARLNPAIYERLVLVQAAINDGVSNYPSTRFYARWPLHGGEVGRHPKHLGRLEEAHGARIVALDVLLDELRSSGRIHGPVKFVKLDVDGPELEILRGGRQTFLKDRPSMLIEISPYT